MALTTAYQLKDTPSIALLMVWLRTSSIILGMFADYFFFHLNRNASICLHACIHKKMWPFDEV